MRIPGAILRAARDERGLALPLALLALVVLASLSGVLLAIGGSEVSVAGNHLRATQAQYLAEAGLEDAFEVLRTRPADVANAPQGLTLMVNLNGASPALAAHGSYTVQYQAAGGNTVRVVATGTTADGSARRAVTALFTNTLVIDSAILTGGSFTLDGGPTIQGTCGSVFTNGDITIGSNNVSVAGTIGATGTVTTTHTPANGTIQPGQAPKPVPDISAPAFLTLAKASVPRNEIFQLGANGQVLDGFDTLIATVAPNATYNGWTYVAATPPSTTAQWDFRGNSIDAVNGTYYVNGNATISSSPGSATIPWQTSVIATGNLTVHGSPTIRPHITDTLLVAGGDVLIHGNASLGTSLYNGLVAAREQVNLNGNATINGYIVAQGATSSAGLVTGDTIHGNPTITYNCGSISPPIAGPLKILSWGS